MLTAYSEAGIDESRVPAGDVPSLTDAALQGPRAR